MNTKTYFSWGVVGFAGLLLPSTEAESGVEVEGSWVPCVSGPAMVGSLTAGWSKDFGEISWVDPIQEEVFLSPINWFKFKPNNKNGKAASTRTFTFRTLFDDMFSWVRSFSPLLKVQTWRDEWDSWNLSRWSTNKRQNFTVRTIW